jgi:tyrosine-protein phosphatase YwqE
MHESVLLAKYQVKWGFRKAVCTSHRVGKYPNVPEDVIRTCEALQEELVKQNVPLQLTPSMEYRLIPETWPETLEKGYLLPWEGDHILIELPIHKASRIGNIVPEDEIRRLLDMGYQPVLAHPERYLYLDMDRYHSFKDAGVLFQRNIGSLEGLYGEAVSVRTEALMAEGMYDMQGTDLHNERYAQFFNSFGFCVYE